MSSEQQKTRMVLGFVFCRHTVLMISKTRGFDGSTYWNGLGGKVEAGDANPVAAMVREFEEECGVKSQPDQWTLFASLVGSNYEVLCYKSHTPTDSFHLPTTTTDEPVAWLPLEHVVLGKFPTRRNTPWLIMAALDYDPELEHVTVSYKGG